MIENPVNFADTNEQAMQAIETPVTFADTNEQAAIPLRLLSRAMSSYTHYRVTESRILSETVEYEPTDQLTELAGGAASYAKDIRGIARAAWQDLPIDGYSQMWDTVGLGVTDAWRQGAASCGIAESDLSPEERVRRDGMVVEQRGYIWNFITWIYDHRRDGPDKLLWRAVAARAALWGNAWNRAYNEAKARACANTKLRWVLHGRRVTKKSCPDCLKLNGRVYRASIWAKYAVFPQSPDLACGGFRCGCDWGDVGPDERVTPGRPPRLAGQR